MTLDTVVHMRRWRVDVRYGWIAGSGYVASLLDTEGDTQCEGDVCESIDRAIQSLRSRWKAQRHSMILQPMVAFDRVTDQRPYRGAIGSYDPLTRTFVGFVWICCHLHASRQGAMVCAEEGLIEQQQTQGEG